MKRKIKLGMLLFGFLLIGCSEKQKNVKDDLTSDNSKIESEDNTEQTTGVKLEINKHKTSDIGSFTIPYKPRFARNGYIIVEDESTGLKGLVDGKGNIILEVKFPFMEFCGNEELDLVFAQWEDDFERKLAVFDFDGNQLAIVNNRYKPDYKGFYNNQLLALIADEDATYLINTRGEVVKKYDVTKNYVRVLNNKYLVETNPLNTGGLSYSVYSAIGIYDLDENPIYLSDDEMYLIDMESDYFVLQEKEDKTEEDKNWKVINAEGQVLKEFSVPICEYEPRRLDGESITVFKIEDNNPVYAVLNLRTLECSEYVYIDIEEMVDGKAFAFTTDGRNVVINNEGTILYEIPYKCEEVADEVIGVKQGTEDSYIYDILDLDGKSVFKENLVNIYLPSCMMDADVYIYAIMEVENEMNDVWYINFNGETVVTKEEYDKYRENEGYMPLISDDDSILYLVNVVDGNYLYTGYIIDENNIVKEESDDNNVITQSEEKELEELSEPELDYIYVAYAEAAESYYKRYESYINRQMLDENAFFAFEDLNDDGVQELICGITDTSIFDGYSRDVIYMPEIYTYSENEAKILFGEKLRNEQMMFRPFYICKNERYLGEFIISIHASGAGYVGDEFYHMDKDLDVESSDRNKYLIEILEMDAMLPPDVYYNIIDKNGTKTCLTPEEYESKLAGYEIIKYTPYQMFSDSINGLREGKLGWELESE